MASSVVNQLKPIFIFLSLALLPGVFLLMDRLWRWLHGNPRRSANHLMRPPTGDEEHGRTNPRRHSWGYLDNLPRSLSSSTAPMVPMQSPCIYTKNRTRCVSTAERPRPLTDLPSLDHEYNLAPLSRQQPPQHDPLFVLADDITESPVSPLQQSPFDRCTAFAKDSTQSSEAAVSPLEQSLAETRMPFANRSTDTIEPHIAEVFDLAATSTQSQAPGMTSRDADLFPFHRPLPLSLQVQTRTGTLQAYKPVVMTPSGPESDTTTGNFVSNMIKSMYNGASTDILSRKEASAQGAPGAMDQDRSLR